MNSPFITPLTEPIRKDNSVNVYPSDDMIIIPMSILRFKSSNESANIILMKCRCVLHIFVRTDSRVHKICIPVIKLKFVSQNTCSCHLNVVFTGMVCFSFWDNVVIVDIIN